MRSMRLPKIANVADRKKVKLPRFTPLSTVSKRSCRHRLTHKIIANAARMDPMKHNQYAPRESDPKKLESVNPLFGTINWVTVWNLAGASATIVSNG